MAIDSAKLVNLAAHGIKPVQIAAALGLSEGRMSQILGDSRVEELIESRKAELLSRDIDAITSLEQTNERLLGKIGTLVEETECLGEAVRAYETLDKMQKMKEGQGATIAEDGINKIIVQVPVFVQQNLSIITNNVNEIVSVDERSMAPMPTSQVHKLIKEQTQRVEEALEATEAQDAKEEDNGTCNQQHAELSQCSSSSKADGEDDGDMDFPPYPTIKVAG